MEPFQDCLSSPGAEYYRDVEVRGVRFATLRALRPLDNDRIWPAGSYSVGPDGPAMTDKAPGLHEVALRRLCCRLGGIVDGRNMRVGDEGWVIANPITLETLNQLPPDVLEALLAGSVSMDTDWDRYKGSFEKNLEDTSGRS